MLPVYLKLFSGAQLTSLWVDISPKFDPILICLYCPSSLFVKAFVCLLLMVNALFNKKISIIQFQSTETMAQSSNAAPLLKLESLLLRSVYTPIYVLFRDSNGPRCWQNNILNKHIMLSMDLNRINVQNMKLKTPPWFHVNVTICCL